MTRMRVKEEEKKATKTQKKTSRHPALVLVTKGYPYNCMLCYASAKWRRKKFFFHMNVVREKEISISFGSLV